MGVGNFQRPEPVPSLCKHLFDRSFAIVLGVSCWRLDVFGFFDVVCFVIYSYSLHDLVLVTVYLAQYILSTNYTTTMENSLIPQGIEMVQKAIAADGEGDFERALGLYRDALARFTMGLKYEKNEARKKLVLERVEGYMKRAEELSDYLKKQAE